MIKQVINNCKCRAPLESVVPASKRAEWGYIEGDITKQEDLIEYIDEHSSGDTYTKEEIDAKLDEKASKEDLDNVVKKDSDGYIEAPLKIGDKEDGSTLIDDDTVRTNYLVSDTLRTERITTETISGEGFSFNENRKVLTGIGHEDGSTGEVILNARNNAGQASQIYMIDDQIRVTTPMFTLNDYAIATTNDLPDVSIFNPTDNFKTINGESVIGQGNIEIQGGGGSYDDQWIKDIIEETQDVAAAAFNDLNNRLNSLDELVSSGQEVTAALANDLNNRININESIDEQAQDVVAASLNDLNNRINGIHVDPYDDSELRGRIENVENKVEDLQLYKFPNATIYGQPTINNGQISNFSTDNYLQFPFIVDFKGRPFEIKMNFSVNNTSGQHNIFDSHFGLAFAVIDGHFVLAYSTNGTSWDLGAHTGSHDVQSYTDYYIKIVSDGYTCWLKYSFDDNEYYDDIIVSGGSPYPRQIIIGKSLDNRYIFDGIINFNNCLVTISDKVVWQGMDDAGIATRLAVDMSNIDEAGVQAVKDIIGDIPEPVDTSKFLDKTYTGINTLQGKIQIGDYTTNITNAFLHVRNVGSSSITDYDVNGACFSINGDGTASFQHKVYNNTGGGAKNSAVLRFSNKGIQFAINTSSGASPTEAMYKELATEEYVDSKIGNIDSILTNIIYG